MFDYYPDEVSKKINTFCQNVLAHTCAGFMVRNLTKKNGAAGILELMLFPLHDDQGLRSRLVGSMFVRNEAFAQAYEQDKLIFTSMSIADMEYRDIGFGLPETS